MEPTTTSDINFFTEIVLYILFLILLFTGALRLETKVIKKIICISGIIICVFSLLFGFTILALGASLIIFSVIPFFLLGTYYIFISFFIKKRKENTLYRRIIIFLILLPLAWLMFAFDSFLNAGFLLTGPVNFR